MSEWISCAERMPGLGEKVVLANWHRMMAFDPFGCMKDVGVLLDAGGLYWSTQGERRARIVEAFTHWMSLPPDPEDPAASNVHDCPRGPMERCNHPDPDLCCGGGCNAACSCSACHPTVNGESNV